MSSGADEPETNPREPAAGGPANRGVWNVWRQDDNGNRFVISGGHSQAEAEQICADFEARGHKQMYWAAPRDT